MRRADYDYQLGKYKGKVDVITIKDLDLGNVSDDQRHQECHCGYMPP